jgi:3-oxoadipate enol-lactonase
LPHLSINGIDLHYSRRGSGAPLLLIHGLGSSGEDWAFQIPALSPHFDLILPDLRGSGRSGKPAGKYSIAQFADDLWSLLDKLECAKVHIVGFSLGGAVAMEMALMRPQAVLRMVLINSLPSYRVDHWRKWMEARAQMLMVRTLGPRRAAKLIARRLFPRPHQEPMRERVIEVVGNNPRKPYLATIAALTGWCALDRVQHLACPILMLAAEFDYTSLAEKRAYAQRLGATLAVIRDSRHGTPYDSIIACNACVLAFLRGEALPEESMLRADTAELVPVRAPGLLD